MADFISTQDLINVKQDIEDIGLSVNTDGVITPRYGTAYDSLPKVIREMIEQKDLKLAELQTAIDTAVAAGVGAAGWYSYLVVHDNGETQKQINDYIGATWYARVGGYDANDKVRLATGEIVISTIPSNTNDPNSNMTGWRFVDKNTVETISELLTLNNPKDGEVFYVKGFRTPTNFAVANPYKGGGEFTYIASRSAENDGISIFNGWARLNITEVKPEMAGAYANFVDDDEDAIVKAQTLARSLRLPLKLSGWYIKSKPFVCLPWDTVIGTGIPTTRIAKVGNLTSGLASRQAPEKPIGTLDVYDVDALLIFYPYDNQYASNITVKDVFFVHGEYGVDPSAGYGLYAPRHAVCNTDNLQFDNVLCAFYAKNMWNNSHKRFLSVSGVNIDGSKSGNTAMVIYDGEGIYTGTSNIFEHFLFNNFKFAYDIQNMQTSIFTACYGENISRNNATEDTVVWNIVNPHELTLNGCGQESCYGTPIYIRADVGSANCSINLNGFQAVWGANGTTTNLGLNLLTIDGPVKVISNGSNFKKGAEGFIFDGFYLGNNSTLINNGSNFGAGSIQQPTSKYINQTSAITEKDGFIQPTKTVGADMRNGWEDKFGLTIKPVEGATLNIPSGLTDAWGISAYFGLNASEGVQLFFSTTNDNVYKLRRTGVSSSTAWKILQTT